MSPLEQWELQSALNREHASAPDVEAAWADVCQRLDLPATDVAEETPQQAPAALWPRMRPFVRWAAGIAAVVALVLGYRYWSASQMAVPVNVNADSFAIHVPDSVDAVTITTADGHARQAEEDLEFPDRFNGNTREVRLEGEAYFEVKRDAKRPFIVHTDYLTTRVLGTAFNVRARSRRDASVTLVSGRVQVGAGDLAKVLSPGEQAALSGSQLAVKSVDTYPIIQWKEGFFYFDNQSLFFIMQELARWYGVNVSFDDTSKMQVRLHFVVERSKSLREAIANLNALGVVHAEIEGNMVIIN